MGPGLAFVLALVLSLPAGAETPVGLQAKGVDPMAALRNPSGLDVRDALGRPVSATLVEAELKQAQTKAAVQAAFASSLPQAAAVVALIEMLEALRLALRGGGAGEIPQRLFALAPPGRTVQKSPLRSVVVLAFALLCARCWRRPAFSTICCPRLIPIALRC